MDKLSFNNSLSLNKFKTVNNITAVHIIKNPHTGKKFFQSPDDSNISGKVADKLDISAPLYISECADADGVTFKMLHNAGESANILSVL